MKTKLGSAQYGITLAFESAEFGADPVKRFVKAAQDELYDTGGMAGRFEVVATKDDAIIVEFVREMVDDEDFARERQPNDIRKGLLEQFLAEMNDAGSPFPYTIIEGVVFAKEQ